MPPPKKGQSALDPEHVPVKYLQGMGLNHDLADRLSQLCIDAGELMNAARSGESSAGLLLEVPEPRSKSEDPYRLPPPVRQTKQQARKSIARLTRPLGVEDPNSTRAIRKTMVDRDTLQQNERMNFVEVSTARGSDSRAPEEEETALRSSENQQVFEVNELEFAGSSSELHNCQEMQKSKTQLKPAKPLPLGRRPQDCVEEPPEGWYRFKDVLEARGGRLGQTTDREQRPRESFVQTSQGTEGKFRADKPGAAKSRLDDETNPFRSTCAGTRKPRAPHSARAPSSMSSTKGEKTTRLPPISARTGPVDIGVLEIATMGHIEDTKLTSVVRHPRWMRTGGVC